LFIYRRGADIAYLLLYVNDIVLTASSLELLQQYFTMNDIDPLHHFLGASVEH
jgi:hypothetical protein